MNLLTIENMTKTYGDRFVFKDADFSINDNEKIGIIGINGTGKSTLLKMIAGLEEPDSGKITKGRQIHIRYLSQNPVFDEDSTVLEAVLKGNIRKDNEWTVESDAKAMLNKLGIPDFDGETKYLSGGQKKRVALANVLLSPADILILDEPTNHLDNEMSEWLEEYLMKFKGALLMVTHDRYFLDRISNRIVEIDGASIYSYPGNYSEYLRLKAAREGIEAASERKRSSILRTELEWIQRGARARSTKQKARIERFEELRDRKGPQKAASVEMNSISSRLGRKTLEVSGITKSYDGRTYINDFSYIFLKGDRVGIIGGNGCGKTTLLKIINGVVEPDEGIVDIGQTVKIGYFSQENEYMDESLRVIDYIKNVAEYVLTPDGSISASQMLERFLFDGNMQWTYINRLSGGEKRRLYLLRILMDAPNILILDEPTNDLDIQTLTILEDYLDNFDGIVISVSHDRYFLDRIARRIFAFQEDGSLRQYEGGFSDYLAVKEREEYEKAPETEKAQAAEKKDTRVREKKLKFSYKEEKEFETIDDDIAGLEEKIEEMDRQIEKSATDYGTLNSLMGEKALLEAELEEKMERWMYLNDLAEKIELERKS
ncbi:ABC-F family ATP-binding cassette domain-containing protein [Anaerobium acetethylicum]|uniref:ATP-binding cassette, subfamily F, uup n=1 Tax=Anaerobium acetethylicum TaxID=1619234 RepID=A0A1D3TP73_9FIRM|nr:ATP-binding cassette, subfamily F, uup [Anaerobium acetethylicum]